MKTSPHLLISFRGDVAFSCEARPSRRRLLAQLMSLNTGLFQFLRVRPSGYKTQSLVANTSRERAYRDFSGGPALIAHA